MESLAGKSTQLAVIVFLVLFYVVACTASFALGLLLALAHKGC